MRGRLPLPVIPAEAGIQCLCSYSSSFQRKLESSFCCFGSFLEQRLPLVLRPSGFLSLLVQRKEPKKHAPAPCALWASCPKGSRHRSGSADCTSCATAESARSLAPTLRALSTAAAARPWVPGESQSARVLRAEAKSERSEAAFALLLLILGPVSRGEGRPESPVGSRAGMRASSRMGRMPIERTPA